jgi:hypothetical protein
MKAPLVFPLASVLVLFSGLVLAGGAGPDAAAGLAAPAAPVPWLKPVIDIRARYEYANAADPLLGDATAFTVRERIGLQAGPFTGFTALAEFEGTQLLDNHFATPFPTQPGPGPFTAIADPENAELNQAWLQWAGFDTTLKLGRQRLILDNAALVGNVGWRQNEQTYDAVNLATKALDGFDLQYAFIDRVLRIFGAEALGATRNFAGETHLFHATWNGPGQLALTGYAYLMDFDRTGAAFSNNSYGLIAEKPFDLEAGWSLKLRAEAAWQTDASSTPIDYSAGYGHLLATASHGPHSFQLGYEHLGADTGRNKLTGTPARISFRTPLATAHAFNGYADALLNARVAGTPDGIGDLYAAYSTKLPADFNLQLALHLFGGDDFDFDTGWETDAVLSRKLSQNLSAIAKIAWFDSDGGPANPAPFDTFRASIELDFTF